MKKKSPKKSSAEDIASVLVDAPLNLYFDYLVDTSIDICVGDRVVIPFGNQKAKVGVVVKLKQQYLDDSEKETFKLVIDVLLPRQIFNASWLKLVQFSARYYACPTGKVFKNACPNTLRQLKPVNTIASYSLLATDEGVNALNNGLINKRAVKQLTLLKTLKNGSVSLDSLAQQGFNSSHIKTLLDKGFVQKIETPKKGIKLISNLPEYSLNADQQKIVDSFDLSKVKRVFASHLIYGVTGSGKTAVYLNLIIDLFKKIQNKNFQEKNESEKPQVLVLVPEIALTPQMIDRFKQCFGEGIAVYHSDISQTAKAKLFIEVSQGDISVVIGTRSSIFLPFKKLCLIIVDEEHDSSYKQDQGFRYHARDLAIYRAKVENIPIVLGSATPSLESIQNVLNHKMQLHRLLDRATQSAMPKIEMVDRRGGFKTQVLSPKIEQAMRQTLQEGKQVILFLNRRGYAPAQMCESCGWSSHCSQCSCYQTVHKQSNRLLCHHCGTSQTLSTICPSCQQSSLFFVGAGTEQLEQYLLSQFPHHKILRMDRDIQTTSNKLSKALSQIKSNEIDIIIGTQMVVKGHHFPNVEMVCVVDADGGLFSADFRAEEKLFQQLIQISGRAGRESDQGKVYIQSYVPQHAVFDALINKDYWSYAKTLLLERAQYLLPPYSALTQIITISLSEKNGMSYLQQLKQMIQEYLSYLTVQGPVSMPLLKKEGRYYYSLQVSVKTKSEMQKGVPMIQSMISFLNKQPQYAQQRTMIDVDAM